MIPFNIERFRAGETVITRDGRIVKDLTYMESRKQYKLVGTVNGGLLSWTIDGKFSTEGDVLPADLIHPQPEMWVNVYDRGDIFVAGHIHNSEEDSKNKILSKEQYIGTYKLVKE